MIFDTQIIGHINSENIFKLSNFSIHFLANILSFFITKEKKDIDIQEDLKAAAGLPERCHPVLLVTTPTIPPETAEGVFLMQTHTKRHSWMKDG